jgi:hypothetical protein
MALFFGQKQALTSRVVCKRLIFRGFRWTIQERAGKMAGEYLAKE